MTLCAYCHLAEHGKQILAEQGRPLPASYARTEPKASCRAGATSSVASRTNALKLGSRLSSGPPLRRKESRDDLWPF